MPKTIFRTAAVLFALGWTTTTGAADKKWDLFLLFGQSNMAGPPAPEAQDKTTNPRIKVLAYNNCSGLGRNYNQWYLASPPLHECFNGVGPGDYFSKTLIDTSDKLGLGIDTIGLIPCAISGVDIDFFRKGVTSARRKEFSIPPDNTWKGAYPWMVSRIQEAQKKGIVRGILFHQGESNSGQSTWPGQVKEILDSLKNDFGWGDLPFLAGELRYDGCCSGHNTQVAKLPGLIKNCAVVSAKDLPGMSVDKYHFNVAGMRTFGHRYCAAMVPLLRQTMSVEGRVVANGIPGVRIEHVGGNLEIRSIQTLDRVELVSVRGKVAASGAGTEVRFQEDGLRSGVYLVKAVAHDGSMEIGKVVVGR